MLFVKTIAKNDTNAPPRETCFLSFKTQKLIKISRNEIFEAFHFYLN